MDGNLNQDNFMKDLGNNSYFLIKGESLADDVYTDIVIGHPETIRVKKYSEYLEIRGDRYIIFKKAQSITDLLPITPDVYD